MLFQIRKASDYYSREGKPCENARCVKKADPDGVLNDGLYSIRVSSWLEFKELAENNGNRLVVEFTDESELKTAIGIITIYDDYIE